MSNGDGIQDGEVHALIERLFSNMEEDGDQPWWADVIRSLVGKVNELEKDAGVAAPLNDDILRVAFDQRDITDRASIKWYSPNTKLGDRTGSSRRTKKKGVCIHHTAVRGGFGAHKNIVRGYMDMTADELRTLHGSRFRDFHGDVDVERLSHEDIARALALACRYRGHPSGPYNSGVPYHAVTGPNSVLYLNLPFEWVTWHGNGANTDFLGYGWDAHSMHDLINDMDCSEDLVYLIDVARKEGHDIEELTCHCAWANKWRDPGKEFIERVMIPVAEKTGCIINMDFKAKANAKSIREVLKAA